MASQNHSCVYGHSYALSNKLNEVPPSLRSFTPKPTKHTNIRISQFK